MTPTYSQAMPRDSGSQRMSANDALSRMSATKSEPDGNRAAELSKYSYAAR